MEKTTFTHRQTAATIGLMLTASCLAPAAFAGANVPKTALDLGDPAPVLQISHWFKGSPIPQFQKGHVYVVELWATWCVPCRVSIPHLTKLARQYRGKVDIIGVDVLENRDGSASEARVLSKSAAFVKSQGAKMNYHIAADTPDNRVEHAWLGAADEDGIPTAFVIGKDGRIAWIGHPLNLDPVLPGIINGKFDVASARGKRDDLHAVNMEVQIAEREMDYSRLIKIIDDAMVRIPSARDNWSQDRLQAVLNLSYPDFKKQALDLIKSTKGDIDTYDTLCQIITNSPDLSPESYRFGLTLVNEALQQKKNDERFAFYYYAAQMYANLGYPDSAVKMQAYAAVSADADPKLSKGWKDLMHRELSKYQLLALSRTNLPLFETRVRQALAKNKNDVGAYAGICKDIADAPGLSPETYRFGLALVDEALQQQKKKYMLYSRGAALSSRLQDREGAVQMQNASLDEVTSNPNDVSADSKVVEIVRQSEMGLLNKYKAVGISPKPIP